MATYLLKNGQFVIEDRLLEGDLYIRDGFFERFIAKEDQETRERLFTLAVSSYMVLDCQEALVGPGFIDLHVHGGGGADVMDASVEAFQQMAFTHVQYGTTRFLLTTVTAAHETILNVCQAYTRWMESLGTDLAHGQRFPIIPKPPFPGALPLGIHLEGPYIAAAKKGAQNLKYIRSFSMEEIKAYQEAASRGIKVITLAPEKLSHPEFITKLCEEGILVSIGHTEASYEQTKEAFRLGASHVTHLCNAMNPVHHRSPGPIVFALENDGITTEFIADGIHVHPAMIRLALRAKKKDEIAIVTDAISATDLGNGAYELGGLQVTVEDDKAILEDGTLAGSCLTMERAYHFLQAEVTAEQVQLFQMMSSTPAKILGVREQFGSIAPGKVADLVIFRDNKLSDVMVAGRWVKGGV